MTEVVTRLPTATRVLLVEDDEGDAVLVQDLLDEAGAAVEIDWVRSVAAALPRLTAGVDCVLLDLGLPDADGLGALRTVLEELPGVAVLVLTGLVDEHRGVAAVAAGAQDYLVKGQVDGQLLDRSIRYAVERKRADLQLRRLYESELRAAENARLERGLLPVPSTRDTRIRCETRYRPGRHQALLGGDFLDVVEAADGTLHAVIGDVAGHGPDEAALGVSLRIAWRTCVLAGLAPEQVLPTLDAVLVAERSSEEVFATVCTLVLAPERDRLRLWVAGHPLPLLLRRAGAAPLPEEVVGPAIGVLPGFTWGSCEVPLEPGWRLLLFTDGMIEGRTGPGPDRLGVDALGRILDELQAALGRESLPVLADAAIAEVERLNGGEMADDLALVFLDHHPGADGASPTAPPR